MQGITESLERYVIIAGGDGYQTATVTGRAAMEQAFVRAHWPDADFSKPLDEEQQQTLNSIQDADEWCYGGCGRERTNFTVRYEDGWVSVYRLTDDLVGTAVPAETSEDDAIAQLRNALEFYDKARKAPNGLETGAVRDGHEWLLETARKVASS